MRILYDHQVFSLQNAGGISRYHVELLRNLAQMEGVRPELLIGLHNSVHDLDGIPNIRLWAKRSSCEGRRLRYAINEGLTLLELATGRRTFDVYHPTLYRSVSGVRAHKTVVTHHDCLYERYPELFPRAAQVCRCKTQLFHRADRIICISESSRRDLHHFYEVDEAKTCVIHHGARALPLPSAIKPIRARAYLLYVGARPAYKNFEALLRAFGRSSACREFDLLAVGGGPFTSQERALLRRSQLEDRVQQLPAVDNEVLASLYGRAHLFVYPSLYEGFGLPPLEAMLLNTPVLAARTSCIPEICRDGVFYFDPHDPDSLASMLDRACSDEAMRNSMRVRGRAVASEYSWERCARATLDVYRA